MKIMNVNVWGYEESIGASGYPMIPIGGEPIFDLDRAIRLGNVQVGSGHDCFLKGIIVQFDMTLSQAMLAQIERYHFIDIVSSQSKMHKITTVTSDSFNTYVDESIVQKFIELVEKYNVFNKDFSKGYKENYLKMLIYSCPCGLEMSARFTTNYLQLKTIYHQRKNHRLDEWKEFCEWVESLPKFKKLCLGGE